MVTAIVIYCLSANPYLCRSLEIVPTDHQLRTISDCMRGGAIYAATAFRLEYADWFVKGVRCREAPDEVRAWLDEHE